MKLEFEKLEHDNTVFEMDFCPETEILSSISKNFIYLVNIRDIRITKKVKNFEFFNGTKAYGILSNIDYTSK